MIDSEFVQEIFNSATSNELVLILMRVAQVSCSAVIIFTLIRKLLVSKNAMSDHDKMKPGDVLRPILLMGALFLYPLVLDSLDTIAIGIEKLLQSYTPKIVAKPFDYGVFKVPPPTDFGPMEKIGYYMERLYHLFTSPGIFMMDSAKVFSSMLDSLVYGIALLTRAFKLYLLRLAGPFAILASMYDRYEGFAANWVKFYMINYVWVALLFAINFFCDTAYHEILELKLNGAEDTSGFITTLAFLVVLFVKISLYKKSFDFLTRVFSNS